MRVGPTGLVAGLAVVLAVARLAASAPLSSAAGPVCTDSGVCVTASHRPDTVGASTATAERDIAEDRTLTNGARNKLELVKFTESIPAGFTFVKDSLGVCTAAGTVVTCFHGLVSSGQTVANTLVYRTPVLSPGTQQTSTFTGTWCWDGCKHHSPNAARVDSLDLSEATTVRAGPGFDATYLLAGTAADLATGKEASSTDTMAGTWSIPGQRSDLPGTATETPNPAGFTSCPPDGELCRSGDWFHALSPGTESFSPYSTVVYTQYKSLIPWGTTSSNYEVVYTPCLPGDDPAHPGGCTAVRLPRCSAPADLRCTEFVTKLPGGNFRVGVRIGSHNGYMK